MSIRKRLNTWFGGAKAQAEPLVSAAATACPDCPVDDEPDPEVMAAIATVLAIEVKLFLAVQGQRFTFLDKARQPGWNESGRLLVRPYQGVR